MTSERPATYCGYYQGVCPKWDEAEADNARLRGALEHISAPIAYFQRKAEAEGAEVNGAAAVSLSESASYLKEVARQALRGDSNA